MRYIHYFIAFFVLFISIYSSNAQSTANPNKILAGKIIEVCNQIVWPLENKTDSFRIFILADNLALYNELLILTKQKKIKNRPIKLEKHQKLGFKTIPQVLILSEKNITRVASGIRNLLSANVLLINIQTKSSENSVISIIAKNNSATYYINQQNLQLSKLKILAGFYDLFETNVSELSINDSLTTEQKISYLQKMNLILKDSIENVLFLLNNQNFANSKQKNNLIEMQKALEAYSNMLYKQKTDFREQTLQLNQQKKLIEQHNIELKQKQNNQHYGGFVISAILLGAIILLIFVLRNSNLKKSYEKNVLDLDEKQTKINQLNFEINHLRQEFNEQSAKLKEITQEYQNASIFAQKTMNSLLSFINELEFYFEAFNIIMPKDQLSRDIGFFMKQQQSGIFSERYLIAVIDCNYGGITGTMLSLITHQNLKEIVISNPDYTLSMIMNTLNESIIKLIEKNYSNHHIFIDLSIVSIEKQIGDKISLRYIGTKQNLLIFSRQDRNIRTISAENQYIGINSGNEKKYKEKLELAEKGDLIYLFSDGILDQRSPKNEKFKQEGLLGLIDKVGILPVFRQKEIIKSGFQTFMQNRALDDNVTLVGIKL